MADYLTTDSELTSIAEAIRAKGGTSAALAYPTEFISAIQAIETVGTYQSKSVIPTESSQVIVPDTGYDALSSVAVAAISSTYIGSGIAQKSSTDITVAGPTVSIPSGYYSNNIDKTIANGSFVVGSYNIGSIPIGTINLDTTNGVITINREKFDYTIKAHATRSGYIAADASNTNTFTVSAKATTYALDTIDVGIITPTESSQLAAASGKFTLGDITVAAIPSNYVGSNIAQQSAQTIIPGTSDIAIASGVYLTGVQTIAGDTNLIAENIITGITLFGVSGTALAYEAMTSAEIWEIACEGWNVNSVMTAVQIHTAVDNGWGD